MGVSRLQPVLTRHTQVRARQSRAHARQRDRGGRAVRHPRRSRRSRRRSRSTRFVRGWDAGAPAGVLRRGRRGEGPGRGTRRPRATARWRTRAGQRADRSRGRLCRGGARRADEAAERACGLRSVRASCAPTRRRSRRWRWSRRCSATGARSDRMPTCRPQREPIFSAGVSVGYARSCAGSGPMRALLRLTAAGFSRSLRRRRNGAHFNDMARKRWTMSDDYKFGIEEEYFLVDAETKSVSREMPRGVPRTGQRPSPAGR